MKPLLGIFQLIFGCRHRHMSRVFTIKLRTYRVCFDCAREFELPSVPVATRAATVGGGIPGRAESRSEVSAR
jgi:hypothetical protein